MYIYVYMYACIYKIAFYYLRNAKILQNQKYSIYFPGLSLLLIFIHNLFFNTIYNLIPISSLIIQMLSGRKVWNKSIKKKWGGRELWNQVAFNRFYEGGVKCLGNKKEQDT